MAYPEQMITSGRRGIVLPIVLFVLLGITLVTSGLVAVTRSEALSERAALRHARRSLLARAILAAEGSGSGGEGVTSRAMPAGFTLVGAAPDTLGLTHFAVHWVLDPDSVAASLPGAVEASTLPGAGVTVSPSCPESLARPPARLLDPGSLGRGGPLVGLLGPSDLAALATPLEGSVLSGGVGSPVLSVPPAASIAGGAGFGVLVSTGDILFEGTSRFTGIVVSGGSVAVRESSTLEGVVLAAGAVTVEAAASITGCVEVARDALATPILSRSHSLGAGGYLGRH